MAIRTGFALTALVLLAACRDPASEVPVTLKGGLYDVWSRGHWLMQTADKPGQSNVCLQEWEAREFNLHPLEKTTRRFNDCFDTLDPPRGNALSGKRTCPKGIVTFAGEHDADSFAIRGTVVDRGGAQQGHFTMTGRRIGDC